MYAQQNESLQFLHATQTYIQLFMYTRKSTLTPIDPLYNSVVHHQEGWKQPQQDSGDSRQVFP